MFRWLMTLLLLLLGVGAILAQWERGGCPAPGSVDSYDWRELGGDPGRIYLFRNGRQIGGWDYDAGQWRDYDAARGVWSPPIAKPPLEPPPRVLPNFGIDSAKLNNRPRFELNGHTASAQEAIDAIREKIPEDAKKLRITVIGDAADRKRVTDAFHEAEPALKERTTLWSVPPDHWSLTNLETGKPIFRTNGKPTLYVQAPDGKVLHRQDDFAGAQDFEAIRRAIKNYDAAKDPDLRKAAPVPIPPPAPAPSPIPTSSTMPGIALLLGVLGFLFMKRRSA